MGTTIYLRRIIFQKTIRLFALFALAVLVWITERPATAQSPFIDIVSGNSGDTSGTAHNLKIDTNGVISFSNTLVGSYSTAYDVVTTHLMGALSTPTTTGYSTTPAVCTDTGLIGYTGQVALTDSKGTTLQSLLVSSYKPETGSNSDAVGYYKYDVTLVISASSGQPYQITGFADSDNEVQDVILDYGVATSSGGVQSQTGTVLNLTALNGSEVQKTNNAKSNAQFSTAPSTTLGGTHTISIIYYNNSGPSDMSFGVGAQAVPEPIGLALALFGGIPLAGLLSHRHRTHPARYPREARCNLVKTGQGLANTEEHADDWSTAG